MTRLTKPDGDYCREECGFYKSCARRKKGDLCRVALHYDRLRLYENTGWEPEEIGEKGGKSYDDSSVCGGNNRCDSV